jgi:hypothetical protein
LRTADVPGAGEVRRARRRVRLVQRTAPTTEENDTMKTSSGAGRAHGAAPGAATAAVALAITPALALAVTAALALAVTAAGCAPPPTETAAPVAGQAAALTASSTAATPPDIAITWNELAYQTANDFDQLRSFFGVRAIAMVHLAMHDALNAIDARYESYAYATPSPHAQPIAAAAQAAHDVLVALYPAQQATLDSALASSLAGVREGRAKRLGIALGQASAAAILAARQGDGTDVPGSYTPGSDPGDYQYTPPWDQFQFVLQPGFAQAKPFGLRSPDQHRPPPPPPLSSAAYTAAYREVKAVGATNSTVRTPDQTHYGAWWAEAGESSFNRLGRQLARARGLDLWATARMFALLNISLIDGYISVWDAKFHYDTWRPYTAIRAADSDGNSGTEPDLAWTSLRTTPPFPEYPSGHAADCAAAAVIFADVFGSDHVPFTLDSTTAPPDALYRSFDGFSQAARECGESRIVIGFHFRFAIDAGLALGEHDGAYIAAHHLRPLRCRHGEPRADQP